MRPVRLVLEGLHSYRDPVTVDFDELGRYGLFGIFGRIGSGKSTVLDGLTLALYGLVDRVATRSRRGLVNLDSERCEVRLTFLAESDEGPATWEVQRSYRPRDGVAERVASRLVRYHGAQAEVVADKERDVNAAVAEVVGLGAEDFMRAVVLPQGRFQQLLQLRGSERRQMLQRVFRLHAYGEGLRHEVQARHTDSSQRMAEARGEIAGLGDAGEAAVVSAREHAEAAHTRRQIAEASHLEVRERHTRAAEGRAGHTRVRQAQQALAEHREAAAAHEQLQDRLTLARQVAPILAPAQRWRAARRRCAVTVEAARAAADTEAKLGAQLEAAQVHAEQVTQLLGAEGPAVRLRIERLDAAREAARGRAELTEQLTVARSQIRAAQGELTSLEAASAAQAEALAATQRERRRLQRENRSQQVSAQERSQVQRATRSADALTTAQALATEAREAVAIAEAELVRAKEEHAQVEAELRTAHATLAEARRVVADSTVKPGWLAPEALVVHERALRQARSSATMRQEREGELGRARAAAVEAHAAVIRSHAARAEAEAQARDAVEVLRGAEAAVRQAEAAWQGAQHRAVASGLARELEPGRPCAVCGSPHHPAPAVHDTTEVEAEAQVKAHRNGHRRAAARHEAALAGHARAVAALDAAHGRQRAADAAVEAAEGALEQVGVADLMALEAAHAAHLALEGRRREAEQQAVQAEVAVERASAPVAAAASRLDQARSASVLARERLVQRTAAEGAAWASFDAERGDLTLFDVGNAAATLTARDREVDARIHRMEDLEGEVATLEATRADLQDRCTQVRESLADGRARAESLEQRLTALAPPDDGPEDPESALQECQRRLRALEGDVEQATAALTTLSAEHQPLARDLAVAQAEAGTATTAAEEAEHELLTVWSRRFGVPAPGVPDLEQETDQLAASALSEQEMTELAERIDAWRAEEARLAARLHMVEESAEGEPPLCDEAFGALEEQLALAGRQLDEAREAHIAAVRQLAELEARAPRHAELVQGIASTDAELGRLKVLGQVLRGDRFVDFVASDHLAELAARASEHLLVLTQERYTLEIDEEVAFQVRDAHSAGALRPVHTLSGGEAFLTALSLALALSTQVQARSRRPLGFFFLDEGFGTLDPEALDRVMSAIELLRDGERVIGLISHVPAVRERVPRYLWVHRPEIGGAGSSIELRDN